MEWEGTAYGENGSQSQQKYSNQAYNTFNELRKSGQLCDAVIIVEGQSFPCHKTIMSACSPYFRALFTNELFNTDRREVTIPGVSAQMMGLIIDYAYTRMCDVKADNVEDLLPAADQFHVNGLVRACCEYLASQLSPENCIGIYKFAHAYFMHNLERTAYWYIMQHFGEVHKISQEFLKLPVEEVCSILAADELNVKSEENVFEAVLTWIDHDANTRKGYANKLLKTIRLGLLSTQYFIEKVKSHPYVKYNADCKPIIIETLKFLYDLDLDAETSNPIARPRLPHEILFVIGGWSGRLPTNTVETYDTRANCWVTCDAVDAGPRAYHGTVCIDKRIYLVGGFDGSDYFNSVRCFDPVSKTWSEVAPMYTKRSYVSTTVLDGLIYAMGGFDGHDRQNTAERYYPRKNQWTMIQKMVQVRSDAGATSLNGRVYICGGFNGHDCLNSAEFYDPSYNQWTLISSMRNLRSGISVIAYRGGVYALGGFNGITRVNTVEVYHPDTNTWNCATEMDHPRSNFAVQVIDDKIFAIGGFNGITTITNVECYDGCTEEWFEETEMSLCRSGLSACVVTDIPNVLDYIHKDRGEKPDTDASRKKSRGIWIQADN